DQGFLDDSHEWPIARKKGSDLSYLASVHCVQSDQCLSCARYACNKANRLLALCTRFLDRKDNGVRGQIEILTSTTGMADLEDVHIGVECDGSIDDRRHRLKPAVVPSQG